jgi:glycosyltransferase involved in cell wall biosynthesis
VLLTVHSCVLTWWRAVHGRNAPHVWSRYARLARQSLDRADLLAVPSRALLAELVAAHAQLPPAQVIPNGRSISGLPPQRRERLVVTAGRLWDQAKNAALVARAVPAIEGRVALIGPGELDGIDSHGLAQGRGVETLGPLAQSELLHWLRRAAVFAEPARYEPFGLAALEAALCGCAPVLGDIPSLREVWGDAAAFVSPSDPEALASAVNSLLDDPPRRARAAAAARSRALRYTPEAMAGSYLSAYREVALA